MATSSAADPLQTSSEPARPTLGLWLVASFYALVALGPMAVYYSLRSTEVFTPEHWAGTTPFDEYLSLGGVVYAGGAAACAWLLFRRSRHAVWSAALPVVWLANGRVFVTVALVQGTASPSVITGVAFFKLGLFVALFLFVLRLRKQGVLS